MVVVGVGGIGSAALYHLARAGHRVLGLERFRLAHDRGSSHGESRILRLAYFEQPGYVPLARRALELWHGLERESGERLFLQTGGIDGGEEGSAIFEGARRSCEQHRLEHEVVDGRELRRRYPAMAFPRDHRFVLQRDAGTLHPERCIEAQARMAEAWGAEIRTEVRVKAWRETTNGVRVELEDGEVVEAEQIVFCAGAWSPGLVPGEAPPMRVERQVVGWLTPDEPEWYAPEVFPVFNVEVGGGHHYGIPSLHGRGPKVGRFGHLHEEVDPDGLRREATEADRTLLQGFADLFLRGGGALGECIPCMFTHTPDGHFVVDRVDSSPVVVACGFSGHGFKFAPALGEALARIVAREDPGPPFEIFGWKRFRDAPAS